MRQAVKLLKPKTAVKVATLGELRRDGAGWH
jgi:hypothetical protein